MNDKIPAERILRHLRAESAPFRVKRAGPPVWSDAEFHGEAFAANPELYALCSMSENVREEQRTKALFVLLSERSNTNSARTIKRTVAVLLATLPADNVLTVFLALRRIRVNRRGVVRIMLRWIFKHPCLEDMIARRRTILRDCVEHALGRDVARGCAKLSCPAANDQDATDYIRRNLHRHVGADPTIMQALNSLYVKGQTPNGTSEKYDLCHERCAHPQTEEEAFKRPKTVTATNRGDISATLVHIYRGGANDELKTALDGYVARCANRIPRFEGRIAVVLDASASMRGFGEREFALASQSMALRRTLERCSMECRVCVVGGIGDYAAPSGDSDLAAALIDAVDGNPDLVVIISDGYENRLHGDLRRVVDALPRAGVTSPVVFAMSKFTDKDGEIGGLEWRRPAPSLPEIGFWHEQEFPEVCRALFSMSNGDAADRYVMDGFYARLEKLEGGMKPWMSIS